MIPRRDRHELAEPAEAVGVRTDQVLCVLKGRPTLVFYLLNGDVIHSAELERDMDGVLHALRRQRHPKLSEDMRREFGVS